PCQRADRRGHGQQLQGHRCRCSDGGHLQAFRDVAAYGVAIDQISKRTAALRATKRSPKCHGNRPACSGGGIKPKAFSVRRIGIRWALSLLHGWKGPSRFSFQMLLACISLAIYSACRIARLTMVRVGFSAAPEV